MIALLTPVEGTLSDGFGPRTPLDTDGDGVPETLGYHYAQDWAAPAGTPVRAAAAGRVVAVGYIGTYGNAVYIDHGGGLTTRYAHLIERPPIRLGQQLAQGEYFGKVGSTGASTGPHLHFELRLHGVALDPLPYLTTKPATPANGQEEDEEMAKAAGFQYTRAKDGAIVYLVVHSLGSGVYHEYSQGGKGKAMPGNYNNPLAAALGTGSYAKITESHATVIKRAEDAARRTEVKAQVANVTA